MPQPAAHSESRVKSAPESAYAWTRLFAALVLSAVGGAGMWSVIVALPAVQAEFGVARSATSRWFTRHRGMAVAIIASGSYLAGTVWPPVVQHFIDARGWRWTYRGIAVLCVPAMLPLALALRRRSPLTETKDATFHGTSW